MYLISTNRRISRHPVLTSSASWTSVTTYMKSAGERRDRKSDPIKNAITAMIRTVDSGYVVVRSTLVAVRSSSPRGVGGAAALSKLVMDLLTAQATHRVKVVGYVFRNSRSLPDTGGEARVGSTAPFSTVSCYHSSACHSTQSRLEPTHRNNTFREIFLSQTVQLWRLRIFFDVGGINSCRAI